MFYLDKFNNKSVLCDHCGVICVFNKENEKLKKCLSCKNEMPTHITECESCHIEYSEFINLEGKMRCRKCLDDREK